MYWAINIERTRPLNTFSGFSKDQIARPLDLPPEQKPHKAINGVTHLILCYDKLVGYPEKPHIMSPLN